MTLAEGVSFYSCLPPQLPLPGISMWTQWWGSAVPMGKGHLGPRCHCLGVWQQGWWSCSGGCRERRASPWFSASSLPSLQLTACQQSAQGLRGRICPLEVEGQGLGTANCHEMTVRLGGKDLHPGSAPAPDCGTDKLLIYGGHWCEAKTCC